MEFSLARSDQRLICQVARDAIRARLHGEAYALPATTPAHLLEPGSAFVTLHIAGNLRGCIGDLEGRQPLLDSVRRNALAAAFADPRFPPLTLDEYANIDLEVTCLSRPRPIASLEHFEVGRHGIVMQCAGRRAVFLPQVAPEYGWDRVATAEHLCAKAGLPLDAWREGAAFSIFEGLVIEEGKLG